MRTEAPSATPAAAAAPARKPEMFSPLARRLGLVWVAVSLPFVTIVSGFVHTRDAYIFVLIYMASGAYTTPALVVGWIVVSRAPARDKTGYALLYCGLVSAFLIGVGVLCGLATGWTWGNAIGLPAVVFSGMSHALGIAVLVRSRSGRRVLSVDLIESVAATVAVAAPLVVLWGPSVFDAEAAWFTVPCALMLLFAITGTYWAIMLSVRLGPGRGLFELCAVGLGLMGVLDLVLQIAQGASGFTLPFPPLIAFNALCFSQFLLVPLNVPTLLRAGLDRLPLLAQVRGGALATVIALGGLAALLLATANVADERSWAVPFALGVVSLLFLLAGLRQIAAVSEIRRLYAQVEQASDERQRLMTQLLERNVHDRRHFASQLYEQAIAAYTSFTLLAGTGQAPAEGTSAVAKASAMLGGDLARHAESVRELVQAIRPFDGEPNRHQRLIIPIRAYVTTIYGDRPPPRLTIDVPDDIFLDWISETVLLQIAQEALHNVWRHSEARAVGVTVEATQDEVALRITDDGVGFDLAAVAEGPGLAVMRASAAVIGGTLTVESKHGAGTTVTARLVPGSGAAPADDHPPTFRGGLRLVRSHPDDT